jgi:hypothetical protein
VFGIVESKWSLQGGAHWSAASEWRGWRPDGVPLTWRDQREESLTAARSADEDGSRCAWLVTGNVRNDVLGGGERPGTRRRFGFGCASMARPSVCSVMDVRPT